MRDKLTFNKLVRDRIPEVLAEKGVAYEVRTLDESEFETELRKKVIEEAAEVLAATDELASEIADLEEVLGALKKLKGIDEAHIAAAKEAAAARKGGFDKRVYLLWTEDDTYKKN